MSDSWDPTSYLYEQADKRRSSSSSSSNSNDNLSQNQSAWDWQGQWQLATKSNDDSSGSGEYAAQSINRGDQGSNDDVDETRWQRW
ncbi:uncharacterized protein EURHEDRAFT_376212 [Aspergillus ruber CBS 135680]|uniref:Uncharacterized protein n=1 Tax=Aspergillus ruber (strain CBS 135680) TaxID=1388766 RepID=A0A017SJW7_ASPRC|nr:uncharacterized protein EURHEDRAFT_376212 [Aspergillus ruber CBS 135680]EYE96949.1 hypothetical protein EURHEDRAFT_376212 [Aspergillus ruber CBS 135680]